jgi:CTP:molybdopterin cytidylyltransferase MocA
MTQHKIGFLLLGAGSSSRMRGTDKLLQTIDGVPQIERISRQVLQLRFPVFVTVPAADTKRKSIISKTNATIIEVHNSKLGMGHSIAEGIVGITKNFNFLSLAICPCDLPDLKMVSINHLINYFFKSPEMICRPIKRGSSKIGHPVIFPKKYFDELKLIKGDSGARNILKKNETALNLYDTDDDAYFLDLDTPEGFTSWVKRTAK